MEERRGEGKGSERVGKRTGGKVRGQGYTKKREKKRCCYRLLK